MVLRLLFAPFANATSRRRGGGGSRMMAVDANASRQQRAPAIWSNGQRRHVAVGRVLLCVRGTDARGGRHTCTPGFIVPGHADTPGGGRTGGKEERAEVLDSFKIDRGIVIPSRRAALDRFEIGYVHGQRTGRKTIGSPLIDLPCQNVLYRHKLEE